jgi:hypothetical protein
MSARLIARNITLHTLDPRCLSNMASYDAACMFCQALAPGPAPGGSLRRVPTAPRPNGPRAVPWKDNAETRLVVSKRDASARGRRRRRIGDVGPFEEEWSVAEQWDLAVASPQCVLCVTGREFPIPSVTLARLIPTFIQPQGPHGVGRNQPHPRCQVDRPQDSRCILVRNEESGGPSSQVTQRTAGRPRRLGVKISSFSEWDWP